MPETVFPDEWLAHSLESLVPPERVAELRTKTNARSLWEALVESKVVTNDQILKALSERFRMRIADVQQVEAGMSQKVPEQLVRRFRVLPLRLTDSFLEVATSNPFDLDAEKALAFATAREIRTLLLDPAHIAEKLD